MHVKPTNVTLLSKLAKLATLPLLAMLTSVGLVAVVGLLCSGRASAQVFLEPADWKEAAIPPPPAFDTAKLLSFDVARSSNLVFGVDPASFTVSTADGVVRYVMVATNPSGAKNVMYDGLRCSTAEVITYARAKPDGSWVAVDEPQWRSIYDLKLPRHSLRFAAAGACDGAAPVSSVRELVRKLTTPITQTPG